MREIKFRAWDKNRKKMFNPTGLVFTRGIASIVNEFGDKEVNPESNDYIVMQYTGLKDKNGKEIYEGDVVKSGNKRVWEVKIGLYQYNLDDWKRMGVYADGENCQYPMGDSEWEIIGNIYENPDLLK